MATRRERLEIDLLATDKASKPTADLAATVDKLDGRKVGVELSAEDKASQHVDDLARRLSSLDDDEYRAVLTAEATKLEREVKNANTLLARVDGETAEAVLEAKDLASAKLAAVKEELDEHDRRTVDATLEATDKASDDIDKVDTKLDGVDGRTTHSTMDAEMGSGLSSVLDALDGAPGKMGDLASIAGKAISPTGAIFGLIGGLAAAAQATADSALNVQTMANFTGEDFAYVDKFTRVFETLGGLDANDLIEMVSEVSSTIAQSPELARMLGVDPNFVANHPLQGLVALVDGINQSQLGTAEKMQTIMKIFGEEGGKQISKILGLGVDLSETIEGMPSVVSEEDAANAVALKLEFAEMVANAQKLAAMIGGPVLEHANEFIDVFTGGSDLSNIARQLRESRQELSQLFDVRPASPIVDEWIDAWTRLHKDLQDGTIDDAADDLRALADASGMTTAEVLALAAGTDTAAVSAENLGLAYDPAEGPWGEYLDVTDDVRLSEEEMAAAAEEAAAAEAEANEIREESIDLLEEQADALEEAAELLDEQGDAFKDLADRQDDYDQAQQDLIANTEAYNEAVEEFGENSEEAADALDDIKNSAEAAADAEVEIARQTAIANGQALTQRQALDHWNSSMLATAATMDGPARAAILRRIYDVNQIPPEVRTEIEAAIAEGDLEEADRLLDAASAPRKMYLEAEMNRYKADAARLAAANLASPKTLPINPNLVVTKAYNNALNSLLRPQYLSIVSQLRSGQKRAIGDPFTSAGTFTVGEQGPELVSLPAGSEIVPNHRLSSVDGGQVPVREGDVIINLPAGTTASGMTAAARRHSRRNGAIPLLA